MLEENIKTRENYMYFLKLILTFSIILIQLNLSPLFAFAIPVNEEGYDSEIVLYDSEVEESEKNNEEDLAIIEEEKTKDSNQVENDEGYLEDKEIESEQTEDNAEVEGDSQDDNYSEVEDIENEHRDENTEIEDELKEDDYSEIGEAENDETIEIEGESKEDEYLEFEPLNLSRNIGSGLVQFELTPIGNLPTGVTFNQARTALMNVTSVTHELFRTATTSSVASIVNGAFGRDALFLGETEDRFHIYIAGFEGWVNKEGIEGNATVTINQANHNIRFRAVAIFYPFGTYRNSGTFNYSFQDLLVLDEADKTIPFNESLIAPLSGVSQVQSISHYENRNGELWRILTGNVENPNPSASFLAGPAPSWMSQNTRYYSFDGVFFYTNPRNIRPSGEGAINATNPHMNYFQYLSFRSQSNVTAAEFNNFLKSQLSSQEQTRSVMMNSGQYFVNAQNQFGTNATLQFAKAMLESGRGLSSIAINNNNLFGLNAIDSDPQGNANRFASVSDAISEHANYWMSRGYLYPADWRHAGPHVGHKGSGINVRYASDPYWGSKIAGLAFRIDRAAGGRDINRETIGVLLNTSNVNVTNASGMNLYTANSGNFRFFPFLITATSGNRYQIVTDGAIENNQISRNAIFNRQTAIGFIPQQTNLKISWASNTTPLPSPPGTEVSRMGVTNGGVNFRRGPGTNQALIRLLPSGTAIEIIGQRDGWLHVRVGNETGWVLGSLIQRMNVMGVTDGGVNFRRGPGTNQALIRLLPSGTAIEIIGQRDGWMNVRVGNETGWVLGSLIQRINTVGLTNGGVNFRRGPGTNYGSVRMLSSRSSVEIIGQRSGWMNVRVGNETGWVLGRLIQQVNIVASTNGGVNLRRGPGTNHASIRLLPSKTSINVIGRSNNWLLVRAGNDVGWVSAELIQF